MPQQTKTPENYWGLIIVFGLMLIIIGPMTLIAIFRPAPHADLCPTTPVGRIIPDQILDGTVFRYGGMISLQHSENGKIQRTRLAQCGTKNLDCPGLFHTLQHQVNKPLHAEFCGSTPVSVVFEGQIIYTARPLPQTTLDRVAREDRILFSLISLFLIGVIAWARANVKKLKNK